MSANNLLVELLVEELPPKALRQLGDVFAQSLLTSLQAQGLCAVSSRATPFASPRRLAAHVSAVEAQAADKFLAQKLMPASVGLDAQGNATAALAKKLAALGADTSAVKMLRRESDGKTDILFLDSTARGVTLAQGLQKALEAVLRALPIPKVMSYQLADGWSTVNFVRPAHGLVALHGCEVVPIAVLGLHAGNITRGHRFEAGVDLIVLKDADSYAEQLEREGSVIASFATRRESIVRQLAVAAAAAGGTPIKDDALLDEVTALVERPNVLIGQFDAAFLDVPQECLILTMKANQKYFPLLDGAGKLTHKFLIVSNISPADPSAVIQGNERVVRPRLADAKFFFDQDCKKKLEDRVSGLAKVVYHNKLGSQEERAAKVQSIASLIASKLGDESFKHKVALAAKLAKADLITDMVGEFPELQGVMGRYYALHDGLSVEIADAIEDHYKPRFANDSLPRGPVGTVVALADKLETLVGLFGIGQAPTGDKDPYALRRQALGLIRILMEKNLALNLDELLSIAAGIRGISEDAGLQLKGFVFDRLGGALREQGYSAHEVDAVVSQRPQRLGDIPRRLAAVRSFAALPEAASLAAANKRVGNILKKADGTIPATIDENIGNEPAEIALRWALGDVKQRADIAFEAGDYAASLKALAALKIPIDAFFNDVMVNVDDVRLRNNRLALLAQLHGAMNRVADLSKLST